MGKISETRPGAVFGRLTVLGQYRKSGKVFCVCACECGTVKAIYSHSLGKLTNSCGCLQGVAAADAPSKPTYNTKRTNRLTKRELNLTSPGKARAYRSWNAMWQRSVWPSKSAECPKYQELDSPPEKWKDFNEFFADLGECPEGCTLDRKDSRAGYSRENCRWANVAQQTSNKTTNVFYSNGSEVLVETKLAKLLGLSAPGLKYRRAKGLVPEGWRLISYGEAVGFWFGAPAT